MAPRLLALLLAFVACGLLALPRGGAAQDTRWLVQINKPGGRDLPIAVTMPSGGHADAREIWELVLRDLEISGYFKVIPPEAYLEPAGSGPRPEDFRWEDWEPPGAVVLARPVLTTNADGSVRGEVWVYDVPGRERLGGKAFTADPSQTRVVGHRIANEIIRLVTGEHGIFNTRFAVVSSATGNKEIALADIDGSRVTPITRNGTINLSPAWSPDGSRIAFTSYRGGNPDLYVADLTKGRTIRVSNRNGINTGAAFAPNGSLLALTLSVGGGDSDVFTIPAAGGESTRLTRAAGIDVSPAWSPDGTRLAFASERSGGVQIYVMNADGSNPQRVSFAGDYNTDPAWSPRGDRLAWVGRDGHFDVFTARTDGSDLQRLTQGQGNNEDPTWSPDGRYVAFSSTRSGGSHIWLSTADGRHQVQLTQGGGAYTSPAWSPPLSW